MNQWVVTFLGGNYYVHTATAASFDVTHAVATFADSADAWRCAQAIQGAVDNILLGHHIASAGGSQ